MRIRKYNPNFQSEFVIKVCHIAAGFAHNTVLRQGAALILSLGVLLPFGNAYAQTVQATQGTQLVSTTPIVKLGKTFDIPLKNAAKVTAVFGDVIVQSAANGNKKTTPQVGDLFYEGDSIQTGSDGALNLDMEDGGLLSVRPNTQLRLTKFRAEGDAKDNMVINLIQGGFRAITGFIGHFNKDAYRVQTRVATIGIRGTDHEPYLIAEGSTEGEPGLYDRVYAGGSYIQTAQGRADIAPDKAGFVGSAKVNGRLAKPRVLAAIPPHFKRGRFEELVEKIHAERRAGLSERREKRRAFIKQSIAEQKAAKQSDAQKAAQQKIAARRDAIQARQQARQQAREAKLREKAAAAALEDHAHSPHTKAAQTHGGHARK